eukprot:gene6400-63947_t
MPPPPRGALVRVRAPIELRSGAVLGAGAEGVVVGAAGEGGGAEVEFAAFTVRTGA